MKKNKFVKFGVSRIVWQSFPGGSQSQIDGGEKTDGGKKLTEQIGLPETQDVLNVWPYTLNENLGKTRNEIDQKGAKAWEKAIGAVEKLVNPDKAVIEKESRVEKSSNGKS